MAVNLSSKLCFSRRLTYALLFFFLLGLSVVWLSSLSSSVNKTTSSRASDTYQGQSPTFPPAILTDYYRGVQADAQGRLPTFPPRLLTEWVLQNPTNPPTPTSAYFKSKQGEKCFGGTCGKGLFCAYYHEGLAKSYGYDDLFPYGFTNADDAYKCWGKEKIKADIYSFSTVGGKADLIKDGQVIEGELATFTVGVNVDTSQSGASFYPMLYACDGTNFIYSPFVRIFDCPINKSGDKTSNVVVKLYNFADDEAYSRAGIPGGATSLEKNTSALAFTLSKKVTFKYKERPVPTLAPTLIPTIAKAQSSSLLKCKISGAVALGIANQNAVYNVNLEFYSYYPEAQGRDKLGSLLGFQHFSVLRAGDNMMSYELTKQMGTNMYVMFARVYDDRGVRNEHDGVLAQNGSLINGYLPLTNCQESQFVHPLNSGIKGCVQKPTYCEPIVGGNL